MKKTTIYILTFWILSMSSSCKKYLDQVPDDRITIEEAFQKKGPSEQYLANVYSYIQDPADQYNNVPWAGNSDEIEIAWVRYIMYKMNTGNWTPSSDYYDIWGNSYQGIRAATYFLNHIDGNREIIQLNGQELIDQYKAEARFVRAYLYFSLMRQYGPVVLTGEKEMAPDAANADLQLPRSSFDECVSYVSSELDKAAAVLPFTPVDDRSYGRATKGAALALKSRLLLYAASPLYNGNSDYSSFKNQDGKPLISQAYNQEKWKTAADAARAVIDLNTYTLYTGNGEDPATVYNNIFFKSYNSEVIFSRKANDLYWWDVNSSPRAAGGYSGVGPTQEMVDAYAMKDGLPVSKSPLYKPTGFTDGIYNMYLNREPRFYASILYHGETFKGGNITSARPLNFFRDGIDGKYEGTEDFTHTGYLVHKGINPSTNNVTGQFENRGLLLIRLSEIYLNYAEALNEYGGNQADVLKYLNAIRKRAGIPLYGEGENALPVPAGQVNMREAIRSERRIELAFETHRWFDIRRWKIAKDVMKPVHGMNVDGTDSDDFFKQTQVADRAWRQAYMWFPIPQYEIDRSKLVVQNPGW